MSQLHMMQLTDFALRCRVLEDVIHTAVISHKADSPVRINTEYKVGNSIWKLIFQ